MRRLNKLRLAQINSQRGRAKGDKGSLLKPTPKPSSVVMVKCMHVGRIVYCVGAYACMKVCMYVCSYTCIHVGLYYLCICVCMYVYLCVYMHINVYVCAYQGRHLGQRTFVPLVFGKKVKRNEQDKGIIKFYN